jgi:hypothetical protein
MWKPAQWYLDQIAEQPLRLRGRLLLCIGCGLAVACLFSVLALLALTRHRHDFVASFGVSFGTLVGGYFLMALVGGGLVGLLLPLGRRWPGALLLGLIAGFACWTIIASLFSEASVAAKLRTGALLGLAFGPPLGFYVWYLAHRGGQRWLR